jgi:hypothetical protein
MDRARYEIGAACGGHEELPQATPSLGCAVTTTKGVDFPGQPHHQTAAERLILDGQHLDQDQQASQIGRL